MNTQLASTPAPTAGTTRPRTGPILAVVSLALMTVVSAVSGLNVALPDLARETGATQTEITWIVDAYTVVFAGLLLFAGALGDRFGRAAAARHRPRRLRRRSRPRHAHQRPRRADRAPRRHGYGRRGDHADDALGHHHLVPRRGTAQGDRRLGRRRRRRRRARPVRQRHPARVLLVELVLRPQRRPRRGWRWSAPWPSYPRSVDPNPPRLDLVGAAAVARRRRRHRVRDHRGPGARLGRRRSLSWPPGRRPRSPASPSCSGSCAPTEPMLDPRLFRDRAFSAGSLTVHGAVLRDLRPVLRRDPVPPVRGRTLAAEARRVAAAPAAGDDPAGAQRPADRSQGRLPTGSHRWACC